MSMGNWNILEPRVLRETLREKSDGATMGCRRMTMCAVFRVAGSPRQAADPD